MEKFHIKIPDLLERLEKCKKLQDEVSVELQQKFDPQNVLKRVREGGGFAIMKLESFDKLDYANLIYDDVVMRLVEFLMDRGIEIKNKYNKLRLHRNSRYHADKSINENNTADYEYVKSVLVEWNSVSPSHEEIQNIKNEQICFGKSIGVVSENDDEIAALKKSYDSIQALKELIKSKK